MFVAHCLLNQNTRYLGGACSAGCISDILWRYVDLDCGIVQLPCPEEHVWGGVLKRRFLRIYGLGRSRWWPSWALPVLARLAKAGTQILYRRMARRVVRQIRDYTAAGYTVVGIVGVEGSPSCGVTRTMDIVKAVPAFAGLNPRELTVDAQARRVAQLETPGSGLFIKAIRQALVRHNLEVPILGYDLPDEPNIKPVGADLSVPRDPPPQ